MMMMPLPPVPLQAVDELAHLRGQSQDGVIQLSDNMVKDYLVGTSRDFAAAIFFSSDQVTGDSPTLQLDTLRYEYGLAAKAFAEGPDANKVFFFEAKLERSQAPFQMLQVASLPCVLRIGPQQSTKTQPVELPKVRVRGGGGCKGE